MISINLPKAVNANVDSEVIQERIEKFQQIRAELDLTPSQKQELRATFRSAFAEINDLITPAQKQEMKIAWEEGKNFRQVWSAANISGEQNSQIKQIWQEQIKILRDIFTPSQREIIRREISNYFREREDFWLEQF